jgi:hypothetical protein
MGFLSSAALEAAKAGIVNASWFLTLDFVSGPMGIWDGVGPNRVGDVVYLGSGQLSGLPQIKQLVNGQAERATFSLAGTDPACARLAVLEQNEALYREIELSLGFMDEGLQLIGGLHTMWIGIMDSLRAIHNGGTDEDPATATIQVEAATIFASRKRGVLSRYSDRQQKRRSADDRFCERTDLYRFSQKTFPQFE